MKIAIFTIVLLASFTRLFSQVQDSVHIKNSTIDTTKQPSTSDESTMVTTEKVSLLNMVVIDLKNEGFSTNKDSISSYDYSRAENILQVKVSNGSKTVSFQYSPDETLKRLLIDDLNNRSSTTDRISNETIKRERVTNGIAPLTVFNGSLSAWNNASSIMMLGGGDNEIVWGLSLIAAGSSYFLNYLAYKPLDFDYAQAVEMYNYGKMGIMYSYSVGIMVGFGFENFDAGTKTAASLSLIAHPLGTYLGYKSTKIDSHKTGNALLKGGLTNYLYFGTWLFPTAMGEEHYSKETILTCAALSIGLSSMPSLFADKLFNGRKVSAGSGIITSLSLYSGFFKGVMITDGNFQQEAFISGMIFSTVESGASYGLSHNYDFSVGNSLVAMGGGFLGGIGSIGLCQIIGDEKDAAVWYALGSFATKMGAIIILREPYGSVEKDKNELSFFNRLEVNPTAFLPLFITTNTKDYQASFISYKF